MSARWRLLTLDTSCVSALANPEGTNDPAEVAALERIVDVARTGAIELQLTLAYERDFERWNDPRGRAERLMWLVAAPPFERASGIFRLDVSRLDSGDVLAGDEEAELDQALRSILLPSMRSSLFPSFEEAPGAASKVYSDVDHLIAHHRSQADAFVTLDVSTILKRADALAEVGIVGCRPTDALTCV